MFDTILYHRYAPSEFRDMFVDGVTLLTSSNALGVNDIFRSGVDHPNDLSSIVRVMFMTLIGEPIT